VDLLEFFPRLWPFSDNLAILCDFLEKTEQMPPFPAFKENRIFRKGTRKNLIVFDPAKISAIEVTVGYLKFRARANLSSGRVRARDLLMSHHLSQEFSPPLNLGKHELARPEVTQGIGRNNHDQGKNHDHAGAQSTTCEPDKRIAAFPETLEHSVTSTHMKSCSSRERYSLCHCHPEPFGYS
jgi:hypothetical protein